MSLETSNSIPEHKEISVGHSGINSILEAMRIQFEKALEEGKKSFSWKEVEDILSKSGFTYSFIGYHWFRVMMFGRNATMEEEMKNPNGPTSRYPGSQSFDNTGSFIKTAQGEEENITEENYRDVKLNLTEKTREAIYRV